VKPVKLKPGSSTGYQEGDFIEGHGRYKLVRKIAEGGMGAVFEAVQYGVEGFDKRMAIKCILESYTSSDEFVKMFIGEAKLVADLVHENIVQVYQLGRDGDRLYIAMEYVDGVNLERFLDRHFELSLDLPIELGAFIGSRVCRGLEHAHGKLGRDGKPLNIVHRDVSPKNIMLNFEGVVKLTDFGIAKARQYMDQKEGEVLMGKVEYMSPEQASFAETDRRSDIFSLGIVLFELLTGQHIFAVEDIYETLDNVKFKKIPDPREMRPEIPEMLARITLKALERDLGRRYQTAGEMGYDLEHYMYHDRFGPTNPVLGRYLRSIFGVTDRGETPHHGTGGTIYRGKGADTDIEVKKRAETEYREPA
jgi:serine/threonine protein kinase